MAIKLDYSFLKELNDLRSIGFDGGYGEFDPLIEVYLAREMKMDISKFRKEYEWEEESGFAVIRTLKQGEIDGRTNEESTRNRGPSG